MTRAGFLMGLVLTIFSVFAPKPYGQQTDAFGPLPVTRNEVVDSSTDARAALEAFLVQNCAACHGADHGVVSRFDVHDAQSWEQRNLLRPGSPDKSLMYQKISAGEMPPLRAT